MNRTIEKNAFSKDASLALKGVAILLMMFHHCFRDASLYQGFPMSFFPLPEQTVVHLALASKICVSLFAFVSGYGLFLNCRDSAVSASRWAAKRYVGTFSGYWFVWGIAALVCQLINGRFVNTLFRDGFWHGLAYTAIDFSGTAKLFGTPTLNGTWWYMSAAAVFIVLVPAAVRLRKHLWLVLVGVVLFLRVITGKTGDGVFTGENSIFAFLVPFLFGCIFAQGNLFDRWLAIGAGKAWKKAIKAVLEIGVLLLFYVLYLKLPIKQFWEFHFGVVPLVLILFCAEFILPVPVLRTVLRFLGRHSYNIFLVHTFIRSYYLNTFTYSMRHFALVVLVLLLVSLGISLLLELLKKATRYDRLIRAICGRIEGVPAEGDRS